MNCAQTRESCYDYFEQRLEAALRKDVDLHVAACRSCAELYAIACEMTCREFGDQCGDFSEGGLDAERRQLIERHLSICSACREYLRSYQHAVKLARNQGAEMPPAIDQALVAKILALRRRGPG